MLDTEAATSCQMSEATTEKGDQQNEQQRPPGEACIELSEQSFTDAENNNSTLLRLRLCHLADIARVINFYIVFYCIVHRVPKKEATKLLAITFSNLNRF